MVEKSMVLPHECSSKKISTGRMGVDEDGRTES